MDGLSLAISVATIIQFTGACLELSRKWIGPSEFSTSDLTTTRRALVGFNRALVDFQKYLQANEHNEARLSILDHLKPALDQCEKALNILKVFIEEPSITKKHFIGPIFDSQLKESLKDLDDAKELFKLAQQADLQTILSAVERYIRNLTEDVRCVAEDVKKVSDSQEEEATRRERQQILDWITPIDYATQQIDLISLRQEGTGQWLLDSAEFQAWLNSDEQILFCPGIAGAGKTILTSIVVEELTTRFHNNESIGIAYLYCNFRRLNEQKIDDLLASLLKQLADIQPSLPGTVKHLYDKHKTKWSRPSTHELSSAIQSVASLYSRAFILIDALDELSDFYRSKFISAIHSLRKKTRAKFFVTSRPIPDMGKIFQPCLSREIAASNEDVRTYLNGHMSLLRKFVLNRPELQEEIKTEITKAVEGMFLLAELYLRELDDKTTPKGIKSALKQFKKQTQGSSQDQKLKLLSSAYERTMKRINGQKDGLRQLAITVLLWITCAERPLTTSELLHAIAVEEDTLELDEDNIHRIEELVSVCAGLVTIDEESDIIRLAHYTTQEYLDQTKHDWFPDAQTRIVKSCVTYLSFDAFKTGFCSTDEEFRARLQDNAFYGYAAQNWGHHTRKAPPSVQTEEFVLQFLESDMIVAGASQAMLTFGNNSGHNRGPPRGVNGLHLTTYFNLQNYTKQLLQRGHSLEAKDSDGQTPLMWAINNGHDTLVEWLLTNEPDVNSFDTSKRTALHHSACMGQIKSMRLLMQRRAGVEARDSQGQTPLLAAVSKGQTAAVKYLLEVGADPKVFSEEKKGVLHLSIESDNASLEMVELLLAHDAPTDMIHIGNMSPLHSTIQYNRTDIASLLLENRVNIDFGIQRRDRRSLQDGYAAYELKNVNENQEFQTGGLGTLTPLHFAALVGNPKMTAYFLSRGADPNALSHYQETPLHLAISKRVQGSEYEDAWNEDCWRAEFLWDIVEDYNDEDETEAVATQVSDRRQAVIMALLEDDRTNVTLQDVQGSSVLHLIEYHKLASSHLLSPLIQKRAMLSARNLKGQTPLHLASLAGDFNSVEILINKGSDIQAADNEGKSAIHYAAERSSIPVVRLILDSYEGNLDLLALKDNNGRAALHHSLGYICVKFDVVRMLLEKGANANDMDDLGNSPLAHYLSSFQFSIDRNICLVLLECGTNARSVNRAGETLAELYTTSGKVKVEILQLLKQYDVDIAKIDSDGKSLLHRMALGGSLTEEALEYIFGNTNIYLNMTDLSGKTALQYAMEEAGRERPLFLWDGDRWSRTANILLYAT